MKSIIDKARKLHRNQKGFTLIELLVVLAILALIVGLVVPNFFGLIGEAEWVQIAGQHEKMREAVFLFFEDTATWPTELSNQNLTSAPGVRELWGNSTDPGWAGPYLDRPILQENRWEGVWGVRENISLTVGVAAGNFTALVHDKVPHAVMSAVDTGMDDGNLTSGAVQRGNVTGAGVGDDTDILIIIIAKQP